MSQDTVNAGDLYLGRGEVYFDRFDASGLRTGERFLGNCTVFEISIADELREKYSSAEAGSPLLKQVNVRRTPEVAISLDEFNPDTLELFFMGTAKFLLQTGASAANYVPPAARVVKGRWFPLENPAGTPVRGTVAEPLTAVVVTGPAATPVYVLNTDYKVDLISARIYVMPSGAIATGGALEVDFTYPTFTTVDAPYVEAATSSFIEGFLRFKSKQAAGPSMEVEVWKVSITPDGSTPLIGDDFGEFRIRGRVLADTIGHPTEPHFRVYETAAT
jgi:hypothetical protein